MDDEDTINFPEMQVPDIIDIQPDANKEIFENFMQHLEVGTIGVMG